MKTLFTICMAALCVCAKAQEIQKVSLPLSPDSTIVYQGIVPLDSTYKSQTLYKSAKTWFVNNFNSAKAVIQADDQQNGRISGKCFLAINGGLSTSGILGDDCNFYIQIDVKDGKYRYSFYNFYGSGYFMNNHFTIDVNKNYKDYLHNSVRVGGLVNKKKSYQKMDAIFASFDYRVRQLIASLNNSMKNSVSDNF